MGSSRRRGLNQSTHSRAVDDARRPGREREELVRERIIPTNRIGSILATLVVTGYNLCVVIAMCSSMRCAPRSGPPSLRGPGRKSDASSSGSNWC